MAQNLPLTKTDAIKITNLAAVIFSSNNSFSNPVDLPVNNEKSVEADHADQTNSKAYFYYGFVTETPNLLTCFTV
jgi:hypothetical protein